MSPEAPQDEPSRLLMKVSDAMVRLHKEQFGRGPKSARAHWAGADAIIVLLECTLTPAERRLVELGEHQLLRETRTVTQYASVREFCTPVEELTGRTVRAFISGIDTEVDGLVTELFILHPEGYTGPSRTALAEP